ncbi:hypothetical protein IAQ61_007024 [Plenodomus lingam]|uniref:uncharacterized protein n=1 Tax=Leptosphaeria maculans TaxID=5022 RepID=UPI00331FF91C|nr:hypothetical protein IAQ61_007024 [Plenodomus lingam]
METSAIGKSGLFDTQQRACTGTSHAGNSGDGRLVGQTRSRNESSTPRIDDVLVWTEERATSLLIDGGIWPMLECRIQQTNLGSWIDFKRLWGSCMHDASANSPHCFSTVPLSDPGRAE